MADLVWLESPSNPLLTVGDLDTICAAKRKRGAILGVDNTFATPLNQRPLNLGADVAVQSVTKLIGGHSDLLGDVVTVRDVKLLATLRRSRELTGATPGTLEAFLAVRGARTLALRLERAQQNALILAERLARHPNVAVTRHPNVAVTRYPRLASHPTHEAARRQLEGFGTIISFDVCRWEEEIYGVCIWTPKAPDAPGSACGFHAWGSCSNGKPLQVVGVPYTTGVIGSGCQGVQDTVTGHSLALAQMANLTMHELAETITDPRNTGWHDAYGAEIGAARSSTQIC